MNEMQALGHFLFVQVQKQVKTQLLSSRKEKYQQYPCSTVTGQFAHGQFAQKIKKPNLTILT